MSNYNRSQRAYCYAQLPDAGLGNKLFVWAKASVFAYLHNIPLIQSKWTQFKIGPILRRERHWRMYYGYFKSAKKHQWLRSIWVRQTYPQIVDPKMDTEVANERLLYVFKQIPHWSDYFAGICAYRDYLRTSLYSMLVEKYQAQLVQEQPPVISVHVRLGDFRELKPGENFAQVGHVRTPLTYFQDLIIGIRKVHQDILPVTIFSDGHDEELAELLNMPNVSRAKENTDIMDLLLMSKSKLIITSAGSTFSYWAAFLSDAPILLHPSHIHAPLRPFIVNEQYFEGGVKSAEVDSWPQLLLDNIRAIQVQNQI